MKSWYRFAIAYVAVGLVAACASFGSAAKTALDVAQIGRALATRLTDEAAVAQACHVEETLRPALRSLLAGKAAAARGSVDGGACAPDAGTGCDQ